LSSSNNKFRAACSDSKILIFAHTSYIGIILVFIHELAVRARQLSLCSSVG
jgi:hypothetical protein